MVKVVGNMDLNENVFGVDVRADVMHEVVVNDEPIRDRAHRAPRLVQRFAVAESSPGDRRVQAVQDRVA